MEKILERRYSWIELDRFQPEEEELVDTLRIVFYKLEIPVRTRNLEDGSWSFESPWIFEEVATKAYVAYQVNQLDYPKEFKRLEPIQKKLMFHYEPKKLRASRIFVFILVILGFLGVVRILSWLGIIQ